MNGKAPQTLTSLWDFAVWAYDRPQMKTLLLTLQDQEGDDIVLCLSLIAAAFARRPLQPPDVARLIEAVLPWQQTITSRLREARRDAGAAHETALKAQILEAELAAERVALARAQAVLMPFDHIRPSVEAGAAACDHYLLYRAQNGRPATAASRELFARAASCLFET